ncbi:MAG: MFS transporter [Alphaproteobacteria bacterium]|nr:MFS transporter [Alphaproteobacteria bacterium]MBV9150867.1 MFS transporter [Alphaproteobacteria bacterium]
MAASISTPEAALENQRIGRLQITVVAICTLIQMCDGYDVGSIGWAVPSLTHAWNIAPSAFALAFLWSNLGVMVGALVSGPLGDRFGRKPMLLASIAIFGLASLASAFSPSLEFLAGTRFFTGLGIAGGFTGTTALTGDYTPQRLRATMIMVTFTGAPLGGFIGGQVVALLLHEGYGWPIIFIIGGLFPLVLLLISALWLPESPRFLAARGSLAPRHRALLERLDIAPGSVDAQAVDVARGNPIAMLFSEGYALQTVLLWIVFFCSLVNLYLFVFWLPEILHLTGLTPSEAVFATSLHALGAIAAVFYLGYLIDRFGAQRALASHFAVGIVFIALIALVAMPYVALLIVVFLSGATIIGSQTGANATAGKLYPARMRTSGIGWALGIGRLGGIAAAPLGGFLLARGLEPRHVFLSAIGFAVIAAVATALLALRNNTSDVLTPKEVAS